MHNWRTPSFRFPRIIFRILRRSNAQQSTPTPPSALTPSSTSQSAPQAPVPTSPPTPSRKKRFLGWTAGIIAAATATLIVGIATNTWHAVYGFFNHSVPIAVSPASVGPNGDPSSESPTPGNLPGAYGNSSEDLIPTQEDTTYYLTGDLSTPKLPKVASLAQKDIESPTTSWRLELNISGADSVPTVITGMTVHIIHRWSPQVVTVVHSCWQNKCTPVLASPPPRPYIIQPRLFYADLDTSSVDIPARPKESANFPFAVTDQDLEDFELTVDDTQASYEFVVYVNWSQGKDSGTVTVDNFDGQPFTIIPDVIAHSYCYDNGRPRGYADVTSKNDVRNLCDA